MQELGVNTLCFCLYTWKTSAPWLTWWINCCFSTQKTLTLEDWPILHCSYRTDPFYSLRQLLVCSDQGLQQSKPHSVPKYRQIITTTVVRTVRSGQKSLNEDYRPPLTVPIRVVLKLQPQAMNSLTLWHAIPVFVRTWVCKPQPNGTYCKKNCDSQPNWGSCHTEGQQKSRPASPILTKIWGLIY